MPEPAVVELVAVDTDTAERLVVAAVVAPDSVGKSAGIAADGLPLAVEGTLVVLVDTEAAADTPAEVSIAAEVGVDSADIERPAGSDSRTELAVVGTAERVDATDSAERPGSAWASADRNSFLMSTSSSRHSAGTD